MSDFTIATGAWQDHSHTGWYAYALTVDVRTAGYIISAIAAYITIVGGRFWVILSFITHQFRSSVIAKDGVHHQHQLVYRNASSQLGASWLIMRIGFAWKGRARHNWQRMLAFVLPPILCFIAFTAASVLSARITSPSYVASKVLLKDLNCGSIDWAWENQTQAARQYSPWFTNNAIQAKDYARACYQADPNHIADCQVFPRQQLSYTVKNNAPCPFGGKRCLLGDMGAIEMDTGWLNSHEHFGINAKPKDRVEYRKTSVCAILEIDDLIEKVPTQQGTLYRYHLGQPQYSAPSLNYTYQIWDTLQNMAIGYTLMPKQQLLVGSHGIPGWVPMADLYRSDAEVSLFFFAQNSVAYMAPVDDPFFAAHRTFRPTQNGPTYYTSDNLVRVMGCTDQFQFRNPNTGQTTNSTSAVEAINAADADSFGFSSPQLWTASKFRNSFEDGFMYNAVNGMGSAALKAQDDVLMIISPGLPIDQWRIEVQSWFETTLAGVQASILRFTSKNLTRITPAAQLYTAIEPACKNQIIRNVGGYQTFSVLAISVVIIIGFLIIILSNCLEMLVANYRGRWRKTTLHKTRRWQADNMLQQQRLVFKGMHVGEWSKLKSEIPVTSEGEKFAWPNLDGDDSSLDEDDKGC